MMTMLANRCIMIFIQAICFACFYTSVVFGKLNGHCPPLGSVLPAPTHPASHAVVQLAATNVSKRLEGLSSKFNQSAFSVSLRSVHESEPILDFHYTPPFLNSSGTQKVDADTVYRIGSVSKVFTVLGVLLAKGVRWDDPVTKYLPELRQMQTEYGEVRNALTTANWDQITIGALSSHMGGIGADLPFDQASIPRDWTPLGLPKLNGTFSPGCGGLLGLPPCDRTEFFRDFGKRHPVFAPFTTPVYSNIGFTLLGFVLEAVSGKTYGQYIQKSILDPLDLASTSSGTASALSHSFIPQGPAEQTWWGVDVGYADYSGGFYSSTNDLQRLGSAILGNKLLDPAQTRTWLKPVSSTSSYGMLMGGPWEIYRSNNITFDGRLIELYTKSGDLGSYHAKLCLIPDYDVVVTILSAGPEVSTAFPNAILSDMVKALLPAIEASGKTEAETAYVGTYTDSTSNSTITLSLDDGPGLAVSNWTVRGVDVPNNYLNYNGLGGNSNNNVAVSARLYPTNLGTKEQRAWRVVFDVGTPEQVEAQDRDFAWPQNSCTTWGGLDRLIYAFNGLDDVVFSLQKSSSVAIASALDLRGFQVRLRRQSKSTL